MTTAGFAEALGVVAIVLSVWGTVHINNRDRRGFALWIIANVASFAVHYLTGVWTMGARDIVFLALAVDGWFRWGPVERPVSSGEIEL